MAANASSSVDNSDDAVPVVVPLRRSQRKRKKGMSSSELSLNTDLGDVRVTQWQPKSLQQLRDERDTRNMDIIDNASEEDVRAILKKLCKRQPDIMLEFLGSQKSESQPSSFSPPDYCVCGRCQEMTGPYADHENVCCEELPEYCLSMCSIMDIAVLDEATLALARLLKRGPGSISNEEELQRSNRHHAYKQFENWQQGSFNRHREYAIPSCVVSRIRATFPSPNNTYKGFDPKYY